MNRSPFLTDSSWLRPAFTLVELSVTLAIVGLLAAAAAVSVRLPMAQARRELAIERLLATDALLRTQATATGRPLSLRFDVAQGTMSRLATGEKDGAAVVVRGLPLQRVRAAARISDADPIELTYRPDGGSPSYAVQLETGEAELVWVVICGGTGQAIRTHREQDVDSLLIHETRRADAR